MSKAEKLVCAMWGVLIAGLVGSMFGYIGQASNAEAVSEIALHALSFLVGFTVGFAAVGAIVAIMKGIQS